MKYRNLRCGMMNGSRIEKTPSILHDSVFGGFFENFCVMDIEIEGAVMESLSSYTAGKDTMAAFIRSGGWHKKACPDCEDIQFMDRAAASQTNMCFFTSVGTGIRVAYRLSSISRDIRSNKRR